MVKGVGYRMSTRLVEFTRFATAPPPSLPREKRYLLEIEFAAYLDNRESRSTWRLVLQFADVRGYTILARRKSLFLSRPAPSLPPLLLERSVCFRIDSRRGRTSLSRRMWAVSGYENPLSRKRERERGRREGGYIYIRTRFTPVLGILERATFHTGG